MGVRDSHITGGYRPLQLRIVMGGISELAAVVDGPLPVLPVFGGLYIIAIAVVHERALLPRVLVGKVDLDGIDAAVFAEIDPEPFAGIAGGRGPPGADVFVEGVRGGEGLACDSRALG